MAEALLSVDEVAAYLAVPVATVYRWRTHGSGPRGVRVGRYVRYRRADVEAWLDAQYDRDRTPAA